MLVFQPAHNTEVGAEETNGEGVLAIERQRGIGENAARGADRQAFDVGVLRGVLPDAKGLPRRLRFGITDGERGDLVSRRQVALEQDGRYPERIGDVVE